jgi:hypothetical protein
MFKAEVLAHSIANVGTPYKVEAMTMRLVMPRIILAEFNTHRAFSKNTSSSRAVPIMRMLKHVLRNMFFPVYWGSAKPGMQAGEELKGFRLNLAKGIWQAAGYTAVGAAWMLNKVGLHKQITNRLIENFSYITVVMTTTDLWNFINLRLHSDAQPEMYELAKHMITAYEQSSPRVLRHGEWHLPMISESELEKFGIEDSRLISAARCAATSYVTVDGKEITPDRARAITQKLMQSSQLHASPFEHQLTPDKVVRIDYRLNGSKQKYTTADIWARPDLHGNTTGFIQLRKLLPNESASRAANLMLAFGDNPV